MKLIIAVNVLNTVCLGKMMRLYSFLCLLTLVSASAYAQNQDTINQDTIIDDLSSLSLQDLYNLEISVASKKEERISDAPGSIIAYSDKDIEAFGYYTLRDLANITSGYSSFRGIGEISFETRGQYASGGFDNNKHLVLIDGIPFSHTRANRANAEEDLPLFFAKRVEFLKGPGSALYGISAFFGVMNIVSKDIEENGTQVESKASLGSYDFKRRVMTNVIHKTDEGVSKFSVGLFTKDASRDLLGNGQSQSYNLNAVNYDDQSSIFLNISHSLTKGILKGGGFGIIYSRKTGGLGDYWLDDQNQTYESNEITWEQLVPYLKYKTDFSKKTALNSYVKMNLSNENGYIGGYQVVANPSVDVPFSQYNVRVFDYEGLVELVYTHSVATNISGGVNIVSRYNPGAPESYFYGFTADPGLLFSLNESFFPRSSSYNTYSAFTQVQHKVDFLAGLNITAGGRLDIGRVIDIENREVVNKYRQISPRIALVQKITPRINLKGMYGTALRAPLIKEIGLNEEFKSNFPAEAGSVRAVRAETIQSFEISANYSSDKINLMANYFYNKTNDPIGKVPTGLDGENINGNLNGFISATGFEADLNVLLRNQFRLGANYSFAHAQQYYHTDSLLGDVYNVPVSKINGYLTYSNAMPFKYSLTLLQHTVTSYRAGGVTPWGDNNNDKMDGFTVFDLNAVAQLTNVLGLELQVRNVLNTEIKTPTFFAANNLSVPFPGRSFMGTVSFKF